MSPLPLLNALDMARFVARGFLRFESVVPEELNRQFLEEAGQVALPGPGQSVRDVHLEAMRRSSIPELLPGTPLDQAYPRGSALQRLVELPVVRGAIQSLVGSAPRFDHHYVHVTYPRRYHEAGGSHLVSQHTHQDSTLDPLAGFDLQIMYYPHEVTRAMGGTRFIPGTHLRKVSEMALARYQNVAGQQHVVCGAGTLLFLHHGIWHGGGLNVSDHPRTMYKVRLTPTQPQIRQWDMSTLPDEPAKRPSYYIKTPLPETVESILTSFEPWFEEDTCQMEFVNRIKLWRHLSGRPSWDADAWMTRLENPARA